MLQVRFSHACVCLNKDALEERLHWLVVSGRLDLKEAQRAITTDWTAAYQRYVGQLPPYQVRP